MWELQHLTTLWASTACYRDSFTFITAISNLFTKFPAKYLFRENAKKSWSVNQAQQTSRQSTNSVRLHYQAFEWTFICVQIYTNMFYNIGHFTYAFYWSGDSSNTFFKEYQTGSAAKRIGKHWVEGIHQSLRLWLSGSYLNIVNNQCT
jgi:hypothetical protein